MSLHKSLKYPYVAEQLSLNLVQLCVHKTTGNDQILSLYEQEP